MEDHDDSEGDDYLFEVSEGSLSPDEVLAPSEGGALKPVSTFQEGNGDPKMVYQ